MTTLRDTFTFEFPVESILDGINRRIDGERQDLHVFRQTNRHVLSGDIKGKAIERRRIELQDEINIRKRSLTHLRRWRSLFENRPVMAKYRLTFDDCTYFDLPYETRQVGPRF